MKCYYCSTDIRPATILCPVCNRFQNLNHLERLVEYLKSLYERKSLRNRQSYV
jgi:hypothetical protein